MILRIFHSLFFLLCFAALPLAGQRSGPWTSDMPAATPALSPVYHHWDQQDGLPSWNIDVFLQDSRGIMWMETSAGLVNFDGFNFRLIPTAYTAQRSEKILGLAEDVHGNIWLMRPESDGYTVDVLRYATEEVVPLHEYLSLKNPVKIPLHNGYLHYYNIGGKIWIGSVYEAYLYDGHWQKILQRSEKDTNKCVWYPAPEGFWLWESDRPDLQWIDQRGQICGSSPMDTGKKMPARWLDHDLSIWVVQESQTGDGPIEYVRFFPEQQMLRRQKTLIPPKTPWYSQRILGPHKDLFIQFGYRMTEYNDSLYFGTLQYPRQINMTKNFPDAAISGNFYFDRSGALWCVSLRGLLRLELKSSLPFRQYLSSERTPNSTRGLARHENRLYVNSYSGAKVIELSSGRASPFPYTGNQLGMGLLADEEGVWIGGFNHYALYKKYNGQTDIYPLANPTLQSFQVYTFLKSPYNALYAGTSNGLYLLDKGSLRSQHLLANLNIICLHENHLGIWAGTPQGLFLLTKKNAGPTARLQAACKLDKVSVSHIYEDPAGIFWLATKGSGLIRWDPASRQTRAYTTRQGLSHNNIHAVYPDDQGHLWLPSDFGLMRFHIESQSIRTFYKEDGIADNEFNQLSHVRADDGRLFFGGINGITAFYPEQIPVNTDSHLPLHLIEARTFNIRQGTFAYQARNAAAPRQLFIRPSDAYLDLRLSPLLFEERSQFSYYWKIEGFHDKWIQQTTPNIRLSRLPYGRHQLLVKFTRLGNPNADNLLRLQVVMLRPFYLQLPFLLLVAGTVIAAAFLLSYLRNRQLRAANLQLEKEVSLRTRQIEEDNKLISRQASDLRALDEMKSRFFTNVTHELRTPLTLILGPLERVLNQPTRPEKTAEYLMTIQRNALKLLNLVDELLDLSKMESQKLQLHEKPCLLYPFFTRTIEAFRPYAEHQRVRLVLNYLCPENLCIAMDVPKWEKIISNLLSNALKFTPPAGEIVVIVRQSDRQLIVEVTDTGQGIATEDLPFIFDRYFQSKSTQSNLQGGTGIGLSLCREYVRLFNGQISVQSQPGQGATFTIVFVPVVLPVPGVSVETVARAAVQPAAPKESAALSQRPTLLLVEDDKDMLDYISGILSDDYNLLTASNGQLGLNMLDSHTVDLVLSDVMMPQLDGFALLERAKERFGDLPFILLTARIDTADKLHALQLGVDDYLTKPFVEAELKARLSNLLARYDTRRKLRAESALVAAQQPDELQQEALLPFDKKWLQQLDDIIHPNLGNPAFSISTLAEKMNISDRGLYNKIKAYTGLSPNQYLIEVRLLKARQLLETKAYQTAAEVCFVVGFKSPPYFSRIFKNRFGKLPSEVLGR